MGEHRTAPPIPAWHGWGPIVVLPAAVVLLTPADWPKWLYMWMIGWTVFIGCKWLTWRRTPAPHAPFWRHAGYLVAWPGLDARAFLHGDPLPAADRPGAAEWLAAWAKLALGAVILWGVMRLLPVDLIYCCAAGWVWSASRWRCTSGCFTS
jgi:hypothetical protein